jgi:hypothetical protein
MVASAAKTGLETIGAGFPVSKDTVSEKLEHLGNYTKTPTFFIDILMQLSEGIPPTFWKFTFVAWRHWLAPGKRSDDGKGWAYPYEFLTTLEQLKEYGIPREASMQWMAAYSVSGFCEVTYGRPRQFERPATPTVIKYRKDATETEWRCFVAALSRQCKDDRTRHLGGHAEAYRLALLDKVATNREQQKLPVPVGFPAMHDYLVRRLVRQGIAKPSDDGKAFIFQRDSKKSSYADIEL